MSYPGAEGTDDANGATSTGFVEAEGYNCLLAIIITNVKRLGEGRKEYILQGSVHVVYNGEEQYAFVCV